MSDLKNKHLTIDDRIEIQECLNRGVTFKAIAVRVSKDQTTISKEVKKHISLSPAPVKRLNLSGQKLPPAICPSLLKAPFVCNPCLKRSRHCSFAKQFYVAKNAQKEYEELLVEAREGIPLNKETFYEIDRIVTDGIKKGQHLYHITESNNLNISKSTVYRHLHRGYLSACKLDFPRVVKFKKRRSHIGDYVPKSAKIGRTYDDFLNFIEQNEVSSWVEMDTVIGRIGGKAILTLHFTFCNFMIGLLLEDKTAAEVGKKIAKLKTKLYSAGVSFGDIFPIILTDNGGEFSDIYSIEQRSLNEKECSLFFCDPMQSCQKPYIEKNHTLFRDIVPKGNSFNSFNQDTVNLIFSHINSVKRKSLNGKTPYELFCFTFGEKVANALNISHISAEKVCQSPKLLKA
jgi:IS30 family transposase